MPENDQMPVCPGIVVILSYREKAAGSVIVTVAFEKVPKVLNLMDFRWVRVVQGEEPGSSMVAQLQAQTTNPALFPPDAAWHALTTPHLAEQTLPVDRQGRETHLFPVTYAVLMN